MQGTTTVSCECFRSLCPSDDGLSEFASQPLRKFWKPCCAPPWGRPIKKTFP